MYFWFEVEPEASVFEDFGLVAPADLAPTDTVKVAMTGQNREHCDGAYAGLTLWSAVVYRWTASDPHWDASYAKVWNGDRLGMHGFNCAP